LLWLKVWLFLGFCCYNGFGGFHYERGWWEGDCLCVAFSSGEEQLKFWAGRLFEFEIWVLILVAEILGLNCQESRWIKHRRFTHTLFATKTWLNNDNLINTYHVKEKSHSLLAITKMHYLFYCVWKCIYKVKILVSVSIFFFYYKN
jgi:hypothetical protein